MNSNSLGGAVPELQDTSASMLQHMRAARRWLVYAPDKQPFYVDGTPRRGTLDTDTDQAKLASYQEACAAVQTSNGRFAGVGFALGPDGTGCYWQGVDLDNVSENQLLDLVNTAPGYVEMSPSGNGCHAIGYGAYFQPLGSNGTGVEAYAAGRYFTFTEGVVRDAALTCLASWVQGPLAARHGAQRHTASTAGGVVLMDPKTVTELRSALNAVPADDYQIWIRMGCALHGLGPIGRELWITWSQTSPKWKPADAKKWDSFKGDRTGYPAVFKEAQRQGWINPKSNAAQIATRQLAALPFTASASNFRLLHERDFAELSSAAWVIKGVIKEGGIGTIFGPSGTFKSFHALDLMAHICNGWPWMGRRVKQKKCVYIPFEGQGGIPTRIEAWRLAMIKQRGITPSDTGNLGFSFRCYETGIAFLMDPINLRDPADVDRLIRTLRNADLSGCVICIDTLAQASAGLDENSSEMQQMLAIFRRLQQELEATVLIVHHTGKDPDRGMRGWSGIRGALDFAIECKRPDPSQKQGVLFLDKVKDGLDGVPLSAFTMDSVFLGEDDDGDPISSLVVRTEHESVWAPTPAEQRNSEDAQKDLDDEEFVYLWIVREENAGKYPSGTSLENQLGEMKAQRSMTQKRVRGAIARLKAKNRIETPDQKSPTNNPFLRAVRAEPLQPEPAEEAK